jgi:hypothetical protein
VCELLSVILFDATGAWEKHVRCLTVGGAAGSVGGEVCHNLSLKIAANSASAKMVSSPM